MKKMFKSIRYSCLRRVPIKFLYNSKFGFTAKPLVTNTVIITRVFCISRISQKADYDVCQACHGQGETSRKCFFYSWPGKSQRMIGQGKFGSSEIISMVVFKKYTLKGKDILSRKNCLISGLLFKGKNLLTGGANSFL